VNYDLGAKKGITTLLVQAEPSKSTALTGFSCDECPNKLPFYAFQYEAIWTESHIDQF